MEVRSGGSNDNHHTPPEVAHPDKTEQEGAGDARSIFLSIEPIANERDDGEHGDDRGTGCIRSTEDGGRVEYKRVCERVQYSGDAARVVTRNHDFAVFTRELTIPQRIQQASVISDVDQRRAASSGRGVGGH